MLYPSRDCRGLGRVYSGGKHDEDDDEDDGDVSGEGEEDVWTVMLYVIVLIPFTLTSLNILSRFFVSFTLTFQPVCRELLLEISLFFFNSRPSSLFLSPNPFFFLTLSALLSLTTQAFTSSEANSRKVAAYSPSSSRFPTRK